jgi:4-hydroxybenzoyl-CoA thioesterase
MSLVARRTVRIEWDDCDPAGIVWYPRYFDMFDAATAGLVRGRRLSQPSNL